MEETKRTEDIGESSSKPPPTSKPASSGDTATACAFWCYLTLAVSLITLLVVSLPRIGRTDEKTWFLSLPDGLRRHYSAGKLVKVQYPGGSTPMQVFAVEIGPRESETVLLVHGLGCSSYSFRHVLRLLAYGGLHAVAVDLPCFGFSDEAPSVKNHGEWGGLFGYMWSIYAEIKEKGLFSGFDHLIETGEIKDRPVRASSRDVSREMGQILGQLIGSMALAPVHLVLHDSAFVALANWVFANPGIVSSVTIMDASPQSAAFPSPLLNFPVVGHLLLRSKSLFGGLLRLCCSRSVDGLDAEAYRLLLKRSGRCGMLGAWRTLNHSLDVGEWANSVEMKSLPVQVLWSNTFSDRWIDEGRRVASSISRAKLFFHSGSRWPQEDAANEISRMIADFVSSLPKSNRRMEEDGAAPEPIQQLFEDAKHNDHHHHHSHGLDHAQGYMGMYGFDHEW